MRYISRLLALCAFALVFAQPVVAQDYQARGLAARANNAISVSAPALVNQDTLWGDSLTDTNYGPLLGPLVSPTPVINKGVSGQSVLQIGVRQGALSTTFTSTGGAICTSGGDVGTFPVGYEPVTLNGPVGGVTGTVAGHHGTVTLSGATYTFTCDVAGTVPLITTTPFVVDQTWRNSQTQLMWVGHNNGNIAQANLWQTENAIAANIPPTERWAFLSNTYDLGGSALWPGGTFGAVVKQNNSYAFSTFGASHYLDTLPSLNAVANASYPPDAATTSAGIQPVSIHAIRGCGTITADINSSTTSIPLNIGSSGCVGSEGGVISVADVLTVGTGSSSEGMTVSSITGSSGALTATVVRGVLGAAQSHTSGDVAEAVDPIHFTSPCIASLPSWASTYPSANTLCGAQIVANTVATWLGNNPVPAVVAPKITAGADGLTTSNAGITGTTTTQNTVGTSLNPAQVVASQVVVPGTGLIGGGLVQANTVTTDQLNIGTTNPSSASWFSCLIAFGTKFCGPQNNASVSLGNSTNGFTEGFFAGINLFSTQIYPQTANTGSVGNTGNPWSKMWSSAYVHAGTAFVVSGSGATVGAGAANQAGPITAGTTGTSTITITPGTSAGTAPHGYICQWTDITSGINMAQTASTTTSCTITGVTTSGDTLLGSMTQY